MAQIMIILAAIIPKRSPVICTSKVARRFRSVGIVGLPNVGKSSLFNALTQAQIAQSSNYPFTTIEPNKATVPIIDKRLLRLAEVERSKRIMHPTIEFVDIAGLIRDAHKGAGLGNQFLSNIRSCDIVLHMVRCFDDSEIIHVENNVDPVRDIQIIETELALADLQLLDRKSDQLAMKKAKLENPAARQALLDKTRHLLDQGYWLIDGVFTADELSVLSQWQLITLKPLAYVCNVDDRSVQNGNAHSKAVKEFIASFVAQGSKDLGDGITVLPKNRPVVHIAVNLEHEALIGFDDIEARAEYLRESNLTDTGLEKLVTTSGELLKEHVFYTIGPEEARAWVIAKGTTAQSAAGKIHSDIEKGFTAADVIKPDDFIVYDGEAGARAAGKMSIFGKDYVMQDGDVVHFRFQKR